MRHASHIHLSLHQHGDACTYTRAGKRIVGFSAGLYSTLALDDSGAPHTFTFPLHQHGGACTHTHAGQRTVVISASHYSTLALDDSGASHIHIPPHRHVTHATRAGKRILGISAGRYNTLALDDSGTLHTWGLDGCGSDGHVPAKEEAWKVRQAGGGLQGKQVTAFDSGGLHFICVWGGGVTVRVYLKEGAACRASRSLRLTQVGYTLCVWGRGG